MSQMAEMIGIALGEGGWRAVNGLARMSCGMYVRLHRDGFVQLIWLPP
jgi:hypothetical protein